MSAVYISPPRWQLFGRANQNSLGWPMTERSEKQLCSTFAQASDSRSFVNLSPLARFGPPAHKFADARLPYKPQVDPAQKRQGGSFCCGSLRRSFAREVYEEANEKFSLVISLRLEDDKFSSKPKASAGVREVRPIILSCVVILSTSTLP